MLYRDLYRLLHIVHSTDVVVNAGVLNRQNDNLADLTDNRDGHMQVCSDNKVSGEH